MSTIFSISLCNSVSKCFMSAKNNMPKDSSPLKLSGAVMEYTHTGVISSFAGGIMGEC